MDKEPLIRFMQAYVPTAGRTTLEGLLLNIVVNALLSAPSPFQQFAFEQPNRALANFPFSWLPTFVVPIVFLGHITAIRRLLRQPAASLSVSGFRAENRKTDAT